MIGYAGVLFYVAVFGDSSSPYLVVSFNNESIYLLSMAALSGIHVEMDFIIYA